MLEILRNVNVNKSVHVDFRPKGKHVFIAGARNGNKKNEEGKADGYKWKRFGTKK